MCPGSCEQMHNPLDLIVGAPEAAPFHDHTLAPLRTHSTAAATAARGTATRLADSKHDQSIQPPSPACKAAATWPSPYHWPAKAVVVPDVSLREAAQSCNRSETARPAAANRLRPGTTY